jgi:hypothetical protein
MPHPIFMERNPVFFENTVRYPDLGIIHYGYINANSSKLFNESIKFFLRFAFTVAGKDRLYFDNNC